MKFEQNMSIDKNTKYLIEKFAENGIITLYHVSNPVYRETIADEGLKPQIGNCYEAHYEDQCKKMGPAIFLSLKNEYNSTYNDDRYEVKLSLEEFRNLDFKLDHDVDDAVYTNLPIELNKLELIYEGVAFEDWDWYLEQDKHLLKNNQDLTLDFNEI